MSAPFNVISRRAVWIFLVLISLTVVNAQTLPPAPIARAAGIVFSGTVIGIERVAPQSPTDAASVHITFRVEQAFRGVDAGETIVITEWAGLWNGSARYWSGQRLLLFLHSAHGSGFTSPVGGDAGRILLEPGATVDAQAIKALLNSDGADAFAGPENQPLRRQPRNGRSIDDRRPLPE